MADKEYSVYMIGRKAIFWNGRNARMRGIDKMY